MNDYISKITLDLNCKETPIVLSAGQFDVGRKIEVSVTADGESYDVTGCTAVCKGANFAINCDIDEENNKVIITTNENMLSSRGNIAARLTITDGTRVYSTQSFIVLVKSAFEGDITQSDKYSVLNSLINRVIQITETGGILVDTSLDANSNNPVSNTTLTGLFNAKADKATTLAGYGISNAYTSAQTDTKLSLKINTNKIATEITASTDKTKLPNISAIKEYLDNKYYRKDDTYSFEETDSLLNKKANVCNSANILKIPNFTETKNGVTLTASKNHITINGKTTANSTSDIQRAARYLYLIKCSFGSNRNSFATATKSIANIIDELPLYNERLRNVIIENRDFENLIKTYDRPSAVFFVDPPYVSTEKYYNKKYCHFAIDDHKRLNNCLKGIKGRFILTYNDCDFIRDLYKDYNIRCVTRNNLLSAATENRQKFKEVIITNY